MPEFRERSDNYQLYLSHRFPTHRFLSPGGKRPDGATQHYDENSCYCNSDIASCLDVTTGNRLLFTRVSLSLYLILFLGSLYSGSTCPISNFYECRQNSTGTLVGSLANLENILKIMNFPFRQISPYLDSGRNCRGGMGTKCTKNEPCYPCELSSVVVSLSPLESGKVRFTVHVPSFCVKSFGSGRCRTCSTDFKVETFLILVSVNNRNACFFIHVG